VTAAVWQPIRARHLLHERDERAGTAELPLLSVSATRGVVLRSELTGDEPRAEDLSRYKVCDRGDLVINRMSAYQGALGVARQRGIVSPDYAVLRLSDVIVADFVHHLFRSAWFIGEMTARLRGIGGVEVGNVRTPRINVSDLGEISVRVPPVPDQHAIAVYLDTETARIDALIEKKQRMVQLLELRQEAFVRSATSGLTEAYGTTRIKRVADALAGGTPAVDDAQMWDENGTPWVTIGDMTAEKEVERTQRAVSSDGLKAKKLPLGSPGTVLFAMYASVGATAVLGVPATWNQAILGLTGKPGLCHTQFLLYWLRFLRSELGALVRSSTQDNLNAEQVGNLPFPAAPVAIQRAIAATLDRETAAIQRLVARNREMISLVQERRQALITAAVTGELDAAEAA
jgi:type I restriction enzyme, S subunit